MSKRRLKSQEKVLRNSVVRILVFHSSPSADAKEQSEILWADATRRYKKDIVVFGITDEESPLYFKRIFYSYLNKKVSGFEVYPLMLFPGKHYEEILSFFKLTSPYKKGKVVVHRPLCDLGSGILMETALSKTRRKNHAPRSPKSKSSRTDSVFSEFSAAYYARLKRAKPFANNTSDL